MTIENLKGLYMAELKDLYDAENRIVKELPKLIDSAAPAELKNALSMHLEQTRGHFSRLEQIFQSMGLKAQGKTCDGMKWILDEGSHMLKESTLPDVKDAGLITAAQRVEHYEIAAYGTKSWAEQLDDQGAARLLDQTLNEEKEADKKLTEIAGAPVNSRASGGANMSSGSMSSRSIDAKPT
jgi:ferritin-like metal-binding protein YciE